MKENGKDNSLLESDKSKDIAVSSQPVPSQHVPFSNNLLRRKVSRRGFLKIGAGLAALPLITPAASFSEAETFNLKLEKIMVEVKDLPPEFHGYQIAFATDIHLGIHLPNEVLIDAMQMLASEKPDILLLGGDHISIPDKLLESMIWPVRNKELSKIGYDDLSSEIFSRVADSTKLVKAVDGTYGVLGNHDHWIDPSGCVREFARNGVRTLMNDIIEIRRGSSRLRIIGVDDYWNGDPQIPRLGAKERSEARVLLTHNPDLFRNVIDRSKLDFDLGLAGHTHGGQIVLPAIGAITYNVDDPRFQVGLHKFANGSTYTSRGVGVVAIPYRFRCPPEVSIMTLVAV